MSGRDGTPQDRIMESSEEGELEDGEIEDETGSENVDEYDRFASNTTSKNYHIPPLMSVSVPAQKSLPIRGDSPRRYMQRGTKSKYLLNASSSKYPVCEVFESGKLGPSRKRSLESSSRDTRVGQHVSKNSGGPKRRRDVSNDVDVTGDRTTSRRDTITMLPTKHSRKFNRSHKQRAPRRPRSRESLKREETIPSSDDEYKTLLRKHHEIQELIKQEKEKQASEGKGTDTQRGSDDGGEDDKPQSLSPRERGQRARSRSGSLTQEKDVADANSDEEVVEVKNETDEIIEILEEDDELLQLRLLALESATKNVAAREEKENQSQKSSRAERPSSRSESKKAKQRERRQRVKQLFQPQSIGAEIFKVHGEKERFSRFMDFVTSRRRKSFSSQGKNLRRSPSVGKESSKKALETSCGEAAPKEFQFDNYDEVEMDVSEMEESPTLTPVPEVDVSPDVMQALTGSDTDTPATAADSSSQGVTDGDADAKEEDKDAEDEDDEDDEEDVMALREQLLRSLASKRAAKAQAQEQTKVQQEEYVPEEPAIQGPTYEPSPILATSSRMSSPREDPQRTASPKVSSSPLSTPRTQSPLPGSSQVVIKPPPPKAKPKVLPPPIPTHKPVVIQFGNESDSSDNELSPQKPEVNQINFLDQFLKEARRTADAKKSKAQQPPPASQFPKTPDAMHKLPEAHRAEYHKLKEEIARREQQKLGKLTPAGGNSPGTQSPIKEVTISVTRVGGKVQRTVVLKDVKAKDREDKAQDEVKTKGEMAQAAGRDSALIQESQGNLTKHKLVAEKDCRILLALDRQLQRRQVILKQTEARLRQLREELAVGETIAASHRSQIRKYLQQKQLIQKKVQEHATREFQLREDLAKAKGVAIGDVGQSQMLFQVASQLPRTDTVIGGRQKGKLLSNSQTSGKSETELERLQRLEREYANQISMLRKANAKQSAKITKPAPASVVRILKTKTKLLNKKPSTQLLLKDKIVLGHDTPTNTDSENDAEKYFRTKSGKDSTRRRSFLDDNPSLKPNLHASHTKSQNSQSESFKSTVHNKSTNHKPADHLKSTTDVHKSTTSRNATTSRGENEKTSSQKEVSTSAKAPSETAEIVEGLSMPSAEHVERLRCAHAEKSKNAFSSSLLAMHLGLPSDATGFKDDFMRKTGDIKMSITEDVRSIDEDEEEKEELANLVEYTSPLLIFRSYRLSPFFVKEAQLSRLSPSFSHKLDPMKPLCQFELNGTCNDDDCPWQHRKDYEMTDHDVYADILAYTPLIAGSKDWHDAEKREQRVIDYVNKAVKKSKRPENAKKQREALCRAFANAVLTQTKKASSRVIVTQPRSWTPKQTPSNTSHHPADCSDTDPPIVPRGSKTTGSLHVIPLGGDDHERYYSEEGVADLEAAVLARPEDVQMWIKLASRIIGDDSEEQDIDRGLNALSRGLEANQTSSELWLQYLLLYSQREDRADLPELCQQALQFAPSYELYWQCLDFEKSFPAKDALCERMLAFLQGQQAKAVTEQGSHRLLEALLYRVQLYIMTRRVKPAMSVLQGALNDPSAVAQHLTPSDRCLAWLAYIHMIEYQRLPPHLFDPTGCGLGRFVSKKPLIFQWGSSTAIQSTEGLRAAFQEALTVCSRQDKSAGDNVKICLPLYRNLIMLEQITGRHDKAQEICQKLVDDSPSNPDLWLLLIDVHRRQGSNRHQLEQVIKSALKNCRLSATLYNAAAKFAMQVSTKGAVGLLKLCAFAFHSIQDKSAYNETEQIRRLYCSLLKQSLPFDYSQPKLRPGITSEAVEEQSCHLWLNYCLLQELTAEEAVAGEAYEKSLCHLQETEDAQKLWTEYLLFQKSKMAASQDKTEAFRNFTGLVNRCLVSMATEFPLPHSDKRTWLDYSFHNQVVELYVGCLKDDERLDVYERFIDRMPNNVPLAFRACHYASKSLQERGCLHRVKAIAMDVLNKYPECLPFWKIMIALSLHQGRLKEAKMLYQQALDVVPLAANLWKDFFLLEVVHDRQPEDIRKLVLKCRELKVNIEDYLKSILK